METFPKKTEKKKSRQPALMTIVEEDVEKKEKEKELKEATPPPKTATPPPTAASSPSSCWPKFLTISDTPIELHFGGGSSQPI